MLRILLLPEAVYLTEFDVGFHVDEISVLDKKLNLLRNDQNKYWRDGYVTYLAKEADLIKRKDEVISAAKSKIALVGTTKKAESAIKYFMATNAQYRRCEFEICRSKI